MTEEHEHTVPEAVIYPTDGKPWWYKWNPNEVYLMDESVDEAWKTCTLNGVYFGEQDYTGNTGGRISSIFVIFITSLIVTLFPIVAQRLKWLKIPKNVYIFAKNFGSGVIVTTAFIHLMDPAYAAIGPNTCVGMTGNWAQYSFCPAIMLAGAMFTFLVDVFCDFFVERWQESRGIVSHGGHSHNTDDLILGQQDNSRMDLVGNNESIDDVKMLKMDAASISSDVTDFYTQICGFMVLEFGVLFHSVMIGLTLGSSSEYATLYIVLTFHQAFEGLGIGARMSMIPFPKDKRWWPYALCLAYSLTTPIAIAIGIGVRYAYRQDGYTTLVVSGVLDSISTGILLYTGMVELLARDFIFNEQRTKSLPNLLLQLFALLLGGGLMALLGKWA